jgi:hypothetical protein
MIVIPMHSLRELARIESEIHRQTDRSAAIIGSAYVEDALEGLLSAHIVARSNSDLNEVYGRDGPLGGFSAKTRMAYALGLLGPRTRSDLNLVRKVRNRFAHEFFEHLSFGDKQIAQCCSGLWWPTRSALPVAVRQRIRKIRTRRAKARALFEVAVGRIAEALYKERLAAAVKLTTKDGQASHPMNRPPLLP